MKTERINQKKNTRIIQQRSNDAGGSHIVDNRQNKNQGFLFGSSLQRVEDDGEDVLQGKMSGTVQRVEEEDDEVLQGKMAAPAPKNETGLPDDLKAGVENLSGFSLDDVRVHYNSSKPATVQALAYTQGTDIHVAPGQEKHLPHEAWHVAQQMAGRVSPTTNINGMPVNDNASLEHEADVMGEKALKESVPMQLKSNKRTQISSGTVKQLKLAQDRLNVVGETHLESDPRRADERRFVASTIPGGGYWTESEFRTVSGYGDPTKLRSLQRFALAKLFGNKYLNIAKNINSLLNMRSSNPETLQRAHTIAAQAKSNFLLLLSEQNCSKHLDQCRIEINNNSSILSSKPVIRTRLLSELTSLYNMAFSIEMTQRNIQISHLYNLLITFNANMQRVQGLIESEIGRVESEDTIAMRRSLSMHIAANENSTRRGVWKVGDAHRKDIEENIWPEGRKYNLMSKAEFNEEYDSLTQRLFRFFGL